MTPVTGTAPTRRNNKNNDDNIITSQDLNIVSVIEEMTGRWDNRMLQRMNKAIIKIRSQFSSKEGTLLHTGVNYSCKPHRLCEIHSDY